MRVSVSVSVLVLVLTIFFTPSPILRSAGAPQQAGARVAVRPRGARAGSTDAWVEFRRDYPRWGFRRGGGIHFRSGPARCFRRRGAATRRGLRWRRCRRRTCRGLRSRGSKGGGSQTRRRRRAHCSSTGALLGFLGEPGGGAGARFWWDRGGALVVTVCGAGARWFAREQTRRSILSSSGFRGRGGGRDCSL